MMQTLIEVDGGGPVGVVLVDKLGRIIIDGSVVKPEHAASVARAMILALCAAERFDLLPAFETP